RETSPRGPGCATARSGDRDGSPWLTSTEKWCECTAGRSFAKARVEQVAQAVAEQVHPEDGEQQREAGEDGDPRRGDQERLAVGEQRAPRERGRLGAEAEERQSRLGDHVAAHAE